jgi:hypothetical protein
MRAGHRGHADPLRFAAVGLAQPRRLAETRWAVHEVLGAGGTCTVLFHGASGGELKAAKTGEGLHRGNPRDDTHLPGKVP